MESKLKAAKKVSVNTSTSISTETKDRTPPKGAKIRSKEERTTTEEIENGYLVTKNISGTYYMGDKENDYNYYDYSKKWYSKTDPLTITVNDKSVAEAFDEE